MAFLNFNNVAAPVNMGDSTLVEFDQPSFSSSTQASWLTRDGNLISVGGINLQFNTEGRLIGGRVSEVLIDIDGDDVTTRSDVRITGLNANAAELGRNAESFWSEILSGVSIVAANPITEDNVGNGFSSIAGDDFLSAVGVGTNVVTDQGGNDVLTLGNAVTEAAGDVLTISTFGLGGFARYEAGNDQVLAGPSTIKQSLSGDALLLSNQAALVGGDDIIRFTFGNSNSVAVGDALEVRAFDEVAEVHGGDDELEGRGDSRGSIFGDVGRVSGEARIFGGDDTILGGSLGEIISGDVGTVDTNFPGDVEITGGNDTILGGGGDDIISGDLHTIEGTAFTVAVTLAGGDGTIDDGDGNDFLFGDLTTELARSFGTTVIGGDDSLFGGAGDDRLFGQGGNDLLDGGLGDDLLDGGAGNDTVDYSTADSGVTVSLSIAGGQATGGAGTDRIFDVENIIGSNFGDALTGTGGANEIAGGLGNDILNGLGGNDQLFGGFSQDILNGGAGADRLDGGFGNDTLNGGAGGDTANYSGFGGGITVNLSTVGAQNTGAAGIDTIIDVEHVIGADFNDRLTGTGGATGNNIIQGGFGSDLLFGLGGNDNLIGNQGNDNIQGGAGNDTINGGLGRDIMRGGTGNDTYDFADVSHSAVGGQRDRIDDFSRGGANGNDTVDLSAIDANTLGGGNQAFTFIGTSSFTGAAGELRNFSAPGPRRIAEGDVNGDGVADFQIEFFNFGLNLIASDFVL